MNMPYSVAWTRYVGLPVSRPRDRFLHGKWDRDLAHNSEYDVAKTLELVLHLECHVPCYSQYIIPI
jgi:hypothetical protein